MARAKGMLNLSGNIEVLAGAPFDARELVPTKADLTVASNFPYPYVGMETYVTAEDKKYRYMGGDITSLSNWSEIGSGGGGSGLPSGGTTGQYLVKQSATEGDADWQSLNTFTGATSEVAGAAGLVPAPAIGDEDKVLFGDGSWGNIVMPSVDYSQQSVEANIYSTTEKVVGQWKDGKLLYQRTYVGTSPSANDTIQTVIDDITTGMDTAFITNGYLINSYGTKYPLNVQISSTDYVTTWIRGSGIGQKVNSNNGDTAKLNQTIVVTLQYTKTTDSPLASDEKFAGLTASGEVIYKKHLDLTPSSWTCGSDAVIAHNISNIDYVVKFEGGFYNAASRSGLQINRITSGNEIFIWNVGRQNINYFLGANWDGTTSLSGMSIDIFYTKTS